MKSKIILFIVAIVSLFLISFTINLDNLFNYANQQIPAYITKDNTGENTITDEVATLGRVLFYDKSLSANNTKACASCHHQENAFGDLPVQSEGLNGGLTGRHAMRLINSRFSDEVKFFWNERATSLEDQSTKPIQDHVEMGFSGADGDPSISDLITILEQKEYYQTLFQFAFGDAQITEDRMQLALAQFIRSIQSFDSKFDEGLAQTNNINTNFPNYSAQENLGKNLFLTPPPQGGAMCFICHRPPEFDIDPNTLNNGIVGVAGDLTDIDVTNTKAPTLRDLVNPNGVPNGPFMHDGSKATLLDVINHYNNVPDNAQNTNLDFRIGMMQNFMNLSTNDKNALVAFLETLSGNDVYVNEKWSDPFSEDGSITIINGTVSTQEELFNQSVTIFPNPIEKQVTIDLVSGNYLIEIFSLNGKLIHKKTINGKTDLDLSFLAKGIFVLQIENLETKLTFTKKLIKK